MPTHEVRHPSKTVETSGLAKLTQHNPACGIIMKSSHTPLPFDQPVLVALNLLFTESHLRHPALISGFSQHHQWVLVRGFRREQGLLVSPSIAEEARTVDGLLASKRPWVLRQDGAVSQRFFQEMLAHQGASSDDLNVIGRAHSERDAATTIAMGAADVAPGARSAATEAGLAFVPIGWEAFDFALYRGIYFRTLFQRLMDELKTPASRDMARALGGYDLSEVGKLVWASQSWPGPGAADNPCDLVRESTCGVLSQPAPRQPRKESQKNRELRR